MNRPSRKNKEKIKVPPKSPGRNPMTPIYCMYNELMQIYRFGNPFILSIRMSFQGTALEINI